MAREAMTLEEIMAVNPVVDWVKVNATTEEDIRRQQVEDGEDPDAPLPPYRLVLNAREVRAQLQMTPEAFAEAVGVSLATVQSWELTHAGLEPVVQSLLRIVKREPEVALRALAR